MAVYWNILQKKLWWRKFLIFLKSVCFSWRQLFWGPIKQIVLCNIVGFLGQWQYKLNVFFFNVLMRVTHLYMYNTLEMVVFITIMQNNFKSIENWRHWSMSALFYSTLKRRKFRVLVINLFFFVFTVVFVHQKQSKEYADWNRFIRCRVWIWSSVYS